MGNEDKTKASIQSFNYPGTSSASQKIFATETCGKNNFDVVNQKSNYRACNYLALLRGA